MAKTRTVRSAADFLPPKKSLGALREAVQHCRGCDLYKNATQAVFGEGKRTAHAMLVGEQPGDQEDLAGRPFVGPAGKLLDTALEVAGIPRDDVYVTNAVKHFKWTPRGKLRLHGKPTSREMAACRPWLEAELEVIKPKCLVLLGATAAQSLLGASFRITRQRGERLETQWAQWTLATWHPSAVLRAPDPDMRHQMFEQLVSDFKKVAARLKTLD
jgi:DNA polymerase